MTCLSMAGSQMCDIYAAQSVSLSNLASSLPDPSNTALGDVAATSASAFDAWVNSTTRDATGYYYAAFASQGCSVSPSTATVRYLTTWLCGWAAVVETEKPGACSTSSTSLPAAFCSSLCTTITDSYVAMLSDSTLCPSASADHISTVKSWFALNCAIYASVLTSGSNQPACTSSGVAWDAQSCGYGLDKIDDAYSYCESSAGASDSCCGSLAARSSTSSSDASASSALSSSADSGSASANSGVTASGSTAAAAATGTQGTGSSSNGGSSDNGGDAGSSSSSSSSSASTSAASSGLSPAAAAGVAVGALVIAALAAAALLLLLRRNRRRRSLQASAKHFVYGQAAPGSDTDASNQPATERPFVAHPLPSHAFPPPQAPGPSTAVALAHSVQADASTSTAVRATSITKVSELRMPSSPLPPASPPLAVKAVIAKSGE
ncbi:hypothetical protein HK405_011638, partial [Cladochytrium tenue]